jgi:hypothetical protein
MRGVVVDVRPIVMGEKLRVSARIDTSSGGPVEAYLPDRETAALLPRTLLVGDQRQAPTRLLGTARPILRRFVVGRRVRLWEHEGVNYFAFLSWRDVRFTDQASPEPKPSET